MLRDTERMSCKSYAFLDTCVKPYLIVQNGAQLLSLAFEKTVLVLVRLQTTHYRLGTSAVELQILGVLPQPVIVLQNEQHERLDAGDQADDKQDDDRAACVSARVELHSKLDHAGKRPQHTLQKTRTKRRLRIGKRHQQKKHS